MKKLTIPYDIVKNIYENDRGIVNLRKILDSPNKFQYFRNMNAEAIEKSRNEFNRTYGFVSDGNKISLGTNNPYFKIVSDVIMDYAFQDNKIHNLKDIAKDEYTIFHLFINGLKIPEDVILIYCSNSHTDIFVPMELVSEYTNMDILVETLDFRRNQYVSKYFPDNKADRYFNISLTELKATALDKSKIVKENIYIYNDGALIYNDYSVIVEDDKIRITVKDNLYGPVEIYLNPNVKYRRDIIESEKTSLKYFTIDNYKDTLFGGIPKRSLHLYINGMKMASTLIQQKGRKHYLVDFGDDVNITHYTLIVNDNDDLPDQVFDVLGSDYYIYKGYSNDKVTSFIKGDGFGTLLDNYEYDVNKLMNDNGKMFSEGLMSDRVTYYETSDDSYNTKIKKCIKDNPSVLRKFLEYYTQTSRSYIVKKSLLDTEAKFSTDTIFPEGSRPYFNIFINREFLDYKNYTIDSDYIIHINKEVFKEEDNIVEIDELVIDEDRSEPRYKLFGRTEMSNIYQNKDQGLYDCDIILYKNELGDWFESINDMIIMEKVENETSLMYPSTQNIGYKKKTDVVITEEDETITVHFKSLPENTILVYFKNFSYMATFINKNENTDYGSNLVFLYQRGADNPIPIIPKGTPEIFVNGNLYINGIDYIYYTPDNNEKVAGSVISFIRKISKGDTISIIFTEVENKVLLAKVDNIHISEYGLLYFGDFPFPFSLKYLDLFIDGKKIFPADVFNISDKLIRVNNIKVPFKDIFVKTKFNVDYSTLQEFFDVYVEDDFEKAIGNAFGGVDFTRNNPNESQNPDKTYEEMEYDKTKNPTSSGEIVERTSMLVTMYMKWLISNDARTMMHNTKNIDSGILDYFSLYDLSGNVGTRMDIQVDLRNRIFAGFNVIYNCNQKPLSEATKLKMIIDAFIKNGKEVPLNQLYQKFLKNPISNIINPMDFPFTKNKRMKEYWLFEEKDDENILLWENQDIFKYNPEYFIDLFPDKYKIKS